MLRRFKSHSTVFRWQSLLLLLFCQAKKLTKMTWVISVWISRLQVCNRKFKPRYFRSCKSLASPSTLWKCNSKSLEFPFTLHNTNHYLFYVMFSMVDENEKLIPSFFSSFLKKIYCWKSTIQPAIEWFSLKFNPIPLQYIIIFYVSAAFINYQLYEHSVLHESAYMIKSVKFSMLWIS